MVKIRVKVRSIIDTDKPINLKELNPIEKITVGFITQWRQTKFYKDAKRRENEKKFAEIAQKDDLLKNAILMYTYSELSRNKMLSRYEDQCAEIILSIDAKYRENLDRIITHKDFLPFNLELIEENGDMRKAFSSMPYLLRVTKKVIGGD